MNDKEKISQNQIEEMINKQNLTKPRKVLIFNKCNLSEIDFSHLDINNLHFLNCFFDKVYLKNTNKKEIRDCSFKNCDFTMISSSGDLNIYDSRITDSSLGSLELNKLLAYDSKFMDNRYQKREINQLDFRSCDLVSSKGV
ncbi:hypothetical protein OZX68_00855 [Streptococcaceae bacterium ESL0729]|nr:hypothetical protein OZX68_00855 [Streptococcaceae bacterium ESL0729]